jgi:RNA polymerase sigma factor (sigma-70 family)
MGRVVPDLFHDAYPLARKAARVQSAKWMRLLRASGHEREDLEVVCIAEVWGKLNRFDPTKSSLPTFVERIIATMTISFLRRCRARKRMPADADATGIRAIPIDVAIPLRVDVRRALALLDDADQKVARMLLHWNPSEIAKIFGISRASVYRAMERIRESLTGAGLENY